MTDELKPGDLVRDGFHETCMFELGILIKFDIKTVGEWNQLDSEIGYWEVFVLCSGTTNGFFAPHKAGKTTHRYPKNLKKMA